MNGKWDGNQEELNRAWEYWETLIGTFITDEKENRAVLPTAVFRQLEEVKKKYTIEGANLEAFLSSRFSSIEEDRGDTRSFYEVCKDLGIPEYFENSTIQKAEHILAHENVMEWMADQVELVHVGDRDRSKYLYLSGLTACLWGHQEHVFATGASGKGKSHLMGTVIELFPVHKRIILSSITGKALYYLSEERKRLLEHSILFIDEFNNSLEAINVIMAITSNNHSKSRHWATGEGKNGQRETRDLSIPNYIVVWCAAVHQPKHEEFMNRFTVINPSEEEETDEKAIALTVERAACGLERALPESYTVARAVTQLLMEREYIVIIPYKRALKKIFTRATHDRRIPKFLLTLIKASAIAHQRERYALHGVLFATLEDYRIAMDLWKVVGAQTSSKLNRKEQEILDLLPMERERAKGCTEVYESMFRRKENVSRKTVGRYLNTLYDLGYVDREKEGEWKTSPWHYWKTGKDWTAWTALDNGEYPITLDKQSLKSFLLDVSRAWTHHGKNGCIPEGKNLDDLVEEIYSYSSTVSNRSHGIIDAQNEKQRGNGGVSVGQEGSCPTVSDLSKEDRRSAPFTQHEKFEVLLGVVGDLQSQHEGVPLDAILSEAVARGLTKEFVLRVGIPFSLERGDIWEARGGYRTIKMEPMDTAGVTA